MLTQERLTLSSLHSCRGMALYLVLAVLIITVLVAGMFLNLTLSQNRLAHHTVSRTQAYYASRLGMNYAIEMLNRNETGWNSSDPFTYTICRVPSVGCDRDDADLPPSINNITIYAGAAGTGINGTRPLNITVDYRYQDQE